jgi:hypothetical protein
VNVGSSTATLAPALANVCTAPNPEAPPVTRTDIFSDPFLKFLFGVTCFLQGYFPGSLIIQSFNNTRIILNNHFLVDGAFMEISLYPLKGQNQPARLSLPVALPVLSLTISSKTFAVFLLQEDDEYQKFLSYRLIPNIQQREI